MQSYPFDQVRCSKQEMQLSIAFHTMAHEGWTVGEIYLKNLFYALRRTYEKEAGLYLLAPAGLQDAKNHTNSIDADDVILYNMPRRRTPLWMINGLAKRILLCDVIMKGILKQHGIDVIFGPTFVYDYGKVATLSWLPDFQHIHLPEMFSKEECISRDRAFLRCAKISTRIILMSKAVKKDFESFAPMYAYKARVLNPVSYVPQSIYERDLNSIVEMYHLPEKFVYLPNQFWKHKNHELVFQAVRILKDRGIKVYLVCSGNPLDYRHPTYFADLCYKVSKWNIRDQIIYLGLVPHEHVLLLMRQSICVLNPSLFEGWGYTVEEARSVGKKVLLSDIPSHREQNPPKAMFFNLLDRDDLADKLGRIWLSTEPGPDVELEFEARRTLPSRLRSYAETFLSVAKEAFEEVRN
jgi:glycosyltransferase involved in cell wall biosynthesis